MASLPPHTDKKYKPSCVTEFSRLLCMSRQLNGLSQNGLLLLLNFSRFCFILLKFLFIYSLNFIPHVKIHNCYLFIVTCTLYCINNPPQPPVPSAFFLVFCFGSYSDLSHGRSPHYGTKSFHQKGTWQ